MKIKVIFILIGILCFCKVNSLEVNRLNINIPGNLNAGYKMHLNINNDIAGIYFDKNYQLPFLCLNGYGIYKLKFEEINNLFKFEIHGLSSNIFYLDDYGNLFFQLNASNHRLYKNESILCKLSLENGLEIYDRSLNDCKGVKHIGKGVILIGNSVYKLE